MPAARERAVVARAVAVRVRVVVARAAADPQEGPHHLGLGRWGRR